METLVFSGETRLTLLVQMRGVLSVKVIFAPLLPAGTACGSSADSSRSSALHVGMKPSKCAVLPPHRGELPRESLGRSNEAWIVASNQALPADRRSDSATLLVSLAPRAVR